jgi:non-homologous end joining protein Ku
LPASRPYWKGYLKLSFVSCPVALYPATSAAERVSFRQVNRRTGYRLRHKLVDSVTGEAVEASDKARGYEIGEDEFLFVEDRDLAQARSERPPPGSIPLAEPPRRESPPTVPARVSELPGKEDRAPENDEHEDEGLEEPEDAPAPPVLRPQNTRTIEIERFLSSGQIDARYFEKPYYIVPREPVGQEAFAVIRDAMSRAGVIGLARVVLSSRERPFLIEPMGSGLRGVTLRFAHEVRSETDYFSDIPEMKLPAEMMKLAQHIIKTKSEDFDASMLEDHYRAALVRILRKKQAKRPAHPAPVEPAAENVVNLMDALRRSIAAEKRPAARSTSRRSADPQPRGQRAFGNPDESSEGKRPNYALAQ